MAEKAGAAKKRVDWERIEPEWRAGVKSVLQIAADYEKETGHKVSHTAINKHFKGLGVPRDLSEKIRAKADAIVSASLVSAEVSTETTPSDAKIISSNAEVIAGVHLTQRKDIQRSRKLVMSLLGELEHQTEHRELYEQLGELMFEPDEKGMDKLNEIYRKAMSLQGRTGTMKSLSDSLKTLVALEREAFGIDSGKDDEGLAKRPLKADVTVSPSDAYMKMLGKV